MQKSLFCIREDLLRDIQVPDVIQDFSLPDQEYVFQNAAGEQVIEKDPREEVSQTNDHSSASLLIEDQVSRSSILSRRRTFNLELPSLELGTKKTSNFLSLESISLPGNQDLSLSPIEGGLGPLALETKKSSESHPPTQVVISRRRKQAMEEENALEDSDGEKCPEPEVLEVSADVEIRKKVEALDMS